FRIENCIFKMRQNRLGIVAVSTCRPVADGRNFCLLVTGQRLPFIVDHENASVIVEQHHRRWRLHYGSPEAFLTFTHLVALADKFAALLIEFEEYLSFST